MPRPKIPLRIRREIKIKCRGLCCICHARGIQIHHIDEDNTNNNIDNLVPLCLECHNHQSTSGGFVSRLTDGELKEVRDNFYNLVPLKNSQVQITDEVNALKVKIERLSRLSEVNNDQQN